MLPYDNYHTIYIVLKYISKALVIKSTFDIFYPASHDHTDLCEGNL